MEKRNQIIAMLYQNMSKVDADDTLHLIDELCDGKTSNENSALPIPDVRYLLAISALEKIANPIMYLANEAKREGAQLNAVMANQLANNGQWLQDIAKSALGEIANCT